MRILLVGGGSGGHVTPLRAISQSIQQQSVQKHDITVISDRKFYPQTKQLFAGEPTVKLKRIYSGKFRRYPVDEQRQIQPPAVQVALDPHLLHRQQVIVR